MITGRSLERRAHYAPEGRRRSSVPDVTALLYKGWYYIMSKYTETLNRILDGTELEDSVKSQLETLVTDADTNEEQLTKDLSETQRVNLNLTQIISQTASNAEDCIAEICGIKERK